MSTQTIVIIDETAAHRDILARLLRAEGYHVLETTPGPQAVDLAQQVGADLILVDLPLPDQPAWETARALRSLAPIVATTVYGELIPSRRVQALGCSLYFNKPFDFDYLLSSIARLLPAAGSAQWS